MKLMKRKLNPRKEPTQDRARGTVETIVEATAQILNREGFEHISTNKIAEKAGISIGSLYQYFPTKDAIFSLMMERYVKSQSELVSQKVLENKSTDLREIIATIVAAVMESKKKESKFQKMFAQKLLSFARYESLIRQDDELIALFKKHLEPFRDQVRTENIDLALYNVIQCMKCLPIAVLFQTRFDIHQPEFEHELVELFYRYLKR